MEDDSSLEKEEKHLKFIDDIKESEINDALNSYELATKISLVPAVLSFGGGGLAILGGAGIYGISLIGSYFGIGALAGASTVGLATGGIGFAFIGIGVGLAFLINHLEKKTKEKEDDKESIKEFEEKLKDSNSTERKFYNSFIENLNNFLNQKLSILISQEYEMIIKVADKIELDTQEIINLAAKRLIKKVKQNLQAFHNLDKFSILVLGKTGIGKTTLINAILGNEQEGTTIGLPMTMEKPQMKHINRNLFPALDIWDSRGLELSDEFSIENSSNQVINFIKNGLKQEEENNLGTSINFIHCIWYCLTGTRIEKTELEYIKKLKKVYSSDKNLPIIFVYTKAFNDEFSQAIKQVIIKELNDPEINFIEVISKEIPFKIGKNTIWQPKKGLRKLLKQSIELAKKGIESAFFGNIIRQFDDLIGHFIANKPHYEFYANVKKTITDYLKAKEKSTKIFQQYPDIIYNSLNHLYIDDEAYEKNKIKNKELLEPLKEIFRTWYKKKFKEFSNYITEKQLSQFIDEPLQRYYDEAFKKETSEITDFELQSKFQKDAHRENINKKLEPIKNNSKNYFNLTIKNYAEHKKALGTNFVLDVLTREFLKTLKNRTEVKIQTAKKYIKKDLDLEVLKTAEEIYVNLSNGVEYNLIPKSEEDEDTD